MNIVDLLLATGLSLVFLVAVFRPLELAFPAKPGQRFFRPDWLTDLFFFLGQYLLWNALVFWCLLQSRHALNGIVPHDFRSAVAAQPFWLQVLEVVFLSDLCVYWGHRLQHRSSFLWRFHSVHHSAEHLDWLAAHREHPLDTVYTLTLINLPAFVLGFPLEPLAGFIAFRGIWAIYIHSNVRLPLGPLRPLLGAPELHHWHHARDRDAGNYGNVCPLMDVIFGTHVCPDREPESLGLNHPTATTWLGHMVRPLLPHRRKDAEKAGVETRPAYTLQSETESLTGGTDDPTDYRGRRDAKEVGQGR
jgi:sterol desaturase/sphingolipid hydroxylase (fatty acid hydroxylase superfamily)